MAHGFDKLNTALSDRYAIEREIGQGGMATVYLAKDLRHERQVAIKVLEPELAAVIGAERFLAEIKTTANLQHPHILPLHDSGEADGLLYYVMPFVEGESLRERLDRERQLPVEEAVGLAADIAEALDYAHRQGVIHRDIKPANILLHEGRPLIADFGIGLALSAAGGDRLTQTGLSLGTPAYMSPEQASAEPRLDHRTDVYSLAAALYEMLAGRPPFEGGTTPSVLARVLTTEPDRVSTHRSTVPSNVDAAVATALEKLPADRFSTAADFASALADPAYLRRDPGTRAELQSAPAAARSRRTATLIGTAVVVGLAFWLGRASRPVVADPDPIRFSVQLRAGQQINTHPTFLPDGRRLVYGATREDGSYLYLHDLGEFKSTHIPGTLGAEHPFSSPEGDWIAYFANRRLHKVSVSGFTNVPIADVPQVPAGGAWTEYGTIIFGTLDQGLWTVPADGGEVEPLTNPDADTGGGSHGWPQILPDGRVLFTVGTPEGPRLALLNLESRSWRLLDGFGQAGGAQYLPGGFLLYSQSGRLLVASVDPETLEPNGSPVALSDTMGVHVGASHALRKAWFTVAPNGSLAFVSPGGTSKLVWVRRDGSSEDFNEETGPFGQPRISPDGQRVALIREGVLMTYRLPSGIREENLGFATEPVWSWDNREIIFGSTRAGRMSIYRISIDGPGEPAILRGAAPSRSLFPHSISRDGQTLAFYEINGPAARDIWTLPLSGDAEPEPLLATRYNERSPAISPDGDRLAFVSDRSELDRVYVAPFPDGGPLEFVSPEGGTEPSWSRDGSELFYRNGDQMMAVAVRQDGSFGAPEPLFRGPYSLGWADSGVRQYDVSEDGQRFLMVEDDTESGTLGQVHIVLNWLAEVPDLVRSAR
jgi:Tol biopolymer transport system component/tRNA A-37 threonylcarbamoyl transferase component Bud32